MTPAELKNEILTGPLADELAAAWAAGDDAPVAAVLNRRDRPGYIPARALVGTMARRNLWGLVLLASRFRLLPDGSACPFSLFTLFAACELAGYGTAEPPLRFFVSLLTPAMDALVAAGLITSDDRAAVLADEVKRSRIEELAGVGASATAEQVEFARKGA